MVYPVNGRLPPGRRGLKRTVWGSYLRLILGRLPPGRRGLKRVGRLGVSCLDESPSPRKAWIETRVVPAESVVLSVAFPPEGVD